MIVCRRCWCHNDPGSTACWNCRSPISAPADKPAKRAAKALPVAPAEERLASAFVCPKGCIAPPRSRRSPPAPSGHSRTFEIQQHRYAAVSCSRCGFTEIFDLDVVEGKDRAGPVIDASAGG